MASTKTGARKRFIDAHKPLSNAELFVWDVDLRGFGLRMKPTGEAIAPNTPPHKDRPPRLCHAEHSHSRPGARDGAQLRRWSPVG